MKISCEVIKDLLPLYHDGVCSKESCGLIEEHLSECEACVEELKLIDTEFILPKQTLECTNAIKKISVVWHKVKVKSFVKGVIISASICAVLVGIFLGLTQLLIFPVSNDIIEIRDVCQLKDGRIVYHMEIKDDKNLHYIAFKQEKDGSMHYIPYRAAITLKRIMKEGLYNSYLDVDVEEHNKYQLEYGNGTEMTSLYFGTGKDAILIWEKGMKLPAASKELEEMFDY